MCQWHATNLQFCDGAELVGIGYRFFMKMRCTRICHATQDAMQQLNSRNETRFPNPVIPVIFNGPIFWNTDERWFRVTSSNRWAFLFWLGLVARLWTGHCVRGYRVVYLWWWWYYGSRVCCLPTTKRWRALLKRELLPPPRTEGNYFKRLSVASKLEKGASLAFSCSSYEPTCSIFDFKYIIVPYGTPVFIDCPRYRLWYYLVFVLCQRCCSASVSVCLYTGWWMVIDANSGILEWGE